jgi:hypothetical protein
MVRPCIGCNIACVGHTWVGGAVRCTLDPTSGREALAPARQRARRARVAVVGGGPAGLAFASAASQLGSNVALFEREVELGGQMRTWSKLPNRSRVLSAVNHWERVLRDRAVTVTCGSAAASFAELGATFDFVVDATGGEAPRWPQDRAARQIDARTALATDAGWEDVNVIVFDANRHIDAAGIALWLREKGAQVRLLSPFEYAGIGTDPVTYANRLGALRDAQIVSTPMCDVFVGLNCIEILDHSRNLVQQDSDADCVVWCRNNVPSPPLPGGSATIVIGERAGALGLEQVVRQAHDCAIAILCDDKDPTP